MDKKNKMELRFEEQCGPDCGCDDGVIKVEGGFKPPVKVTPTDKLEKAAKFLSIATAAMNFVNYGAHLYFMFKRNR